MIGHKEIKQIIEHNQSFHKGCLSSLLDFVVFIFMKGALGNLTQCQVKMICTTTRLLDKIGVAH